MGINYGIDKARFIAPVPAGARVRGRGEVVSVDRGPRRRAGRRAHHRRARRLREAGRGRRHRLALPGLDRFALVGVAASSAVDRRPRNACTTSGSTTRRIGGSASSSDVAVAGGGEPAVEHRDDAPVLPAADEPARALREHERGRGEVDVAEARAAGALGGLAAGLGERVVGAAERQAVDDDEHADGPGTSTPIQKLRVAHEARALVGAELLEQRGP